MNFVLHQVFCGKLPTNVFEDVLIPLFEKCGTIWDLRLMMDPTTGLNKTFCFVTFTTKQAAKEAVKQVGIMLMNALAEVVVAIENVASFCGDLK